jgi:hypothetical protein
LCHDTTAKAPAAPPTEVGENPSIVPSTLRGRWTGIRLYVYSRS